MVRFGGGEDGADSGGTQQESWDRYAYYVKEELKRLNVEIEKLGENIDRRMDKMYGAVNKVDRDVAALKVKAGFWGAIAAFIVSLATQIGVLFIRK